MAGNIITAAHRHYVSWTLAKPSTRAIIGGGICYVGGFTAIVAIRARAIDKTMWEVVTTDTGSLATAALIYAVSGGAISAPATICWYSVTAALVTPLSLIVVPSIAAGHTAFVDRTVETDSNGNSHITELSFGTRPAAQLK